MSVDECKSLADLCCGVEELDDFFHFEVGECVRNKYLAAYAVIIPSGRIIGAFTLMNDALMIMSENEKDEFIDDLRLETEDEIADFFNFQSSYPAINIGHLGICEEYKRKGIGTAIVDLVAETYSSFARAGCQFITVDALNNPSAISFYLSNQFSFQANRDFYSSTRRMYRLLI